MDSGRKANVAIAWTREIEDLGGLGCHRHQRVGLRHHGQGLRLTCCAKTLNGLCKAGAEHFSALAKDVTELLMADLGPVLKRGAPEADLTVAYHSACSMQHGQQIKEHAQGTAVARPASP